MFRYGIKEYRSISKLLPDNKSNYLHKKNRYKWPNQCKEIVELLAQKSELLKVTPTKWRPTFFVWSRESFCNAQNWIFQEIQRNGIILKPNVGFGSRGIVFYKYENNVLYEKFLFNKSASSQKYIMDIKNKSRLEEIWRNLNFTKKKPILITPYYENSIEFPITFPSAVLRVFTLKKNNLNKSEIFYAWLDIPLSTGKYIFCDLKGNFISRQFPDFNRIESKEINIWQELIKNSIPNSISECLRGSIYMHDKLKNIDQVAWDWIPRTPHPKLLEGNSGFGMFMQGFFNMLYSDK